VRTFRCACFVSFMSPSQICPACAGIDPPRLEHVVRSNSPTTVVGGASGQARSSELCEKKPASELSRSSDCAHLIAGDSQPLASRPPSCGFTATYLAAQPRAASRGRSCWLLTTGDARSTTRTRRSEPRGQIAVPVTAPVTTAAGIAVSTRNVCDGGRWWAHSDRGRRA
jgi:hypothetical protein